MFVGSQNIAGSGGRNFVESKFYLFFFKVKTKKENSLNVDQLKCYK